MNDNVKIKVICYLCNKELNQPKTEYGTYKSSLYVYVDINHDCNMRHDKKCACNQCLFGNAPKVYPK